jgi:CheY-like chemotaxis protein
MGVPLEKQAHLFEPFVQVDASTARRFGGSGLGLSIVKRLAQRMGGTVGLVSEPGRGARFWFQLPLRVTSAPLPARPSPQTRFATQRVSGVAPKVLVVEDTATNRLVITALLKKLGCEVALAENGEQAVVMLRDGARPDVVLMDLHMPVLDGFGATAAIRAWERERDAVPVPIVALTADAFERDRQHCLAAGMNGFLTKPVVVDELRAELARWERQP